MHIVEISERQQTTCSPDSLRGLSSCLLFFFSSEATVWCKTSFLVNQTLTRLWQTFVYCSHTRTDHLSAVPQTTGCVRALGDHSLWLRLHLTHQKVNRILPPAPADCHGCSAFFLLLLLFFSVSLGTVRGDVASHALWSAPLPGTKLYSFMFREKGELQSAIQRWVENRGNVVRWRVTYDLRWQQQVLTLYNSYSKWAKRAALVH